MSKKKTHEEFIKEVYNLVGEEYTVLGKYINCKEKILIRHNCDECGNYEFYITPDSFINKGSRCHKCGIEKVASQKRKTHEQFIKEVYDLVGDEYTILGQYVNNKTKILIRHNCEECEKYEFYMTPDAFVNKGSRCRKCSNRSASLKNSKPHEQAVREIMKVLGDEYEVLSKYKNSNTKLKIKHNACGNIYEATFHTILKGRGCPKCRQEQKFKIKTKSHEDFIRKVKEKFGDEFEILEEYKGRRVPIKIQHKTCGHTRSVTPDVFMRSVVGCPKCAIEYRSQKRITKFNVFLEQLKDIYGDEIYIYEDTYKDMNKSVKAKHVINGKIFYTTPYLLLKGHLYKEYGIKKRADAQRWTTEEFKNKVYSLVQDEYTVLGKYTGANNKILMKHNKCNYEYEVTPSKFINAGRRCPRCRESKGEKAISQFLDKLHVNYQPQFSFEDCRNKEPLPFDFAIFDNDDNIMCLIEYQGEHHYEIVEHFGGKEKFQIQQKRDEIKRQYCRLNNIKLVEIPYWEFDNIEKILNKELHIV